MLIIQYIVAFLFIIFYYKRICKKRRTLEEPIVRYHTRNVNESASLNLTQVTSLPVSSLTGYSHELSTPSYKNPLLTRRNLNFPKKDSVITLCTPMSYKNVSTKDFSKLTSFD